MPVIVYCNRLFTALSSNIINLTVNIVISETIDREVTTRQRILYRRSWWNCRKEQWGESGRSARHSYCCLQSLDYSFVSICHLVNKSVACGKLTRQPGAKTIKVFRACLGAQLTICAQKWRNFVLFSTVSLRIVLSRVCVFLYSLGPRSRTCTNELVSRMIVSIPMNFEILSAFYCFL